MKTEKYPVRRAERGSVLGYATSGNGAMRVARREYPQYRKVRLAVEVYVYEGAQQ